MRGSRNRPRNRCKIVLQGSFDPGLADYVGDMLVDEQVAGGAILSTTLAGHTLDVESFLGTLHMLVDRGLSVLACEYVQATPGEAAAGDNLPHNDTNATP